VTSAPRHLNYHFEGFDEACLGFGNADATRRVMFVPPLFDEMNRMRATLVGAMRKLAERGVATLLPDLPGCNESLASITAQSIESWRGAIRAANAQLCTTHLASIRGGALLVTGDPLPQWQLAPVQGSSLLKTMLRTRIVSDKEGGLNSTLDGLLADAQHGPLNLSGYRLSAGMLASLDSAIPASAAFEAALSDVAGKPLWLRAEPQEDAEMSTALAAELDRWSASCGG
jgi:hypothetical protein